MTTASQQRLRRVSSRQNALVKELRRAFARGERADDGSVAIESVRIVEEAVRSGLRFRAVLFRESSAELAERLLPQIAAGVETLVLPDDVFDSAVATESPQGVAALVRVKEHKLDDVLRAPEPLVVCVAGVQDPGNLGTIVRSAEAFGAHGVLLAEKTVSAFNPKAVRASAGSLFRVPVVNVAMESAIAELRTRGLRLVATSSHKGTPLDEAKLAGGVALFIGSEGAGLPRGALAKMDEVVAITHSPRVESLNAGVAASILLYEAARQRR
jgi:RNA methyltransferase, TrmH family